MRVRNSKMFLTAALAALLIAACGGDSGDSASQSALQSVAVGEMANFTAGAPDAAIPDLMVNDPQGESRPLSDDLAQVTLVNLWATWCAPCVTEMPSLNALQAAYDPDEFRVVPISLDQTPEKAQAFYAEKGLDALVFRHDPDLTSASLLNAPGLPISVLYDAEGHEIGRINGPAEWDSEDAHALIDAALKLKR